MYTRVVLRCALMEYGALYQMMAGLSMMLLLCADNLDTVINVRALVSVHHESY